MAVTFDKANKDYLGLLAIVAAAGVIALVAAFDSLRIPLAVTSVAGAIVFSCAAWIQIRRRDASARVDALSVAQQQPTVSDVVAQKIARAKVEELEAEVKRLREAERELSQAKSTAEAAATAKAAFLATMSHEIRTPLNGIIPILELVLRAPLELEVQRHVSAAFHSSRDMLRIVNDVLDFSHMESSAVEFEVSALRPSELVDSVTTLMRRSAEAKGLKIGCVVASGIPPTVRGDALRLKQVLGNLVSNAVKFTQRGRIDVNCSLAKSDRVNHWLRFEICDTGVGIRPDASDKLFRPFSQADASTSRLFGGTGLGLAICHRIVSAMGGTIGVDSALGKGSRFWFEVPLLRAAGETDGQPEVHALFLCRNEEVSGSWLRVLQMLEVRTVRVESAFEASQLLKNTLGRADAPCLVLIDLASAEKTSAGLVRTVLADDRFASLKMLLLGEKIDGFVDDEFESQVHVSPAKVRDISAMKTLRAMLEGKAQVAGCGAERAVVKLDEDYSDACRGMKILLVDDIQLNRYVGQRTLEKMGATVALASGGREAISMVDRDRYDAVLLDCQMPDVDGFAVAKVIRAKEAARDTSSPIPIIAMTANAMAGDRERCLAAGMNEHIPKPIDSRQLAMVMRAWTPSSQGVSAQ
jgi:signal transduction histidine kinase/CheY-like chemotaxis protein